MSIIKIGATIIIVGLLISGVIVADKQISQLEERVEVLQETSAEFGAFNPVGSGFHYLAGSGITANATSVTLTSLQTRDGREITMSNFGEIGYATIEPGSSDKLEFISFTGISQAGASDQATLSGVSRGLDPLYPYNASSSLAYSHSGGSLVIFSNSPAFYDEIVFERTTSTITGQYTFSSSSPPRYDTTGYSFITGESWLANKAYVDNVATSGAADASGDTKGLVEIPTRSEVASGASAGSGDTTAYMCLPTDYASSTQSATTTIPITGTDGKLAQGFLDLTEAFNWTGIHSFSASTSLATTTVDNLTVSGTSTLNGKSVFNATSTFSKKVSFGTTTLNDIFSVYGDGHDGARTVTTSVSLTEDVYYTDLTISSGGTLDTNGYRIFVSGTLTNEGTISNNGNGITSPGDTGTLRGGSNGGSGETSSGSCQGGDGGDGGGVVFIAAHTIDNASGTIEANGGDGQNGTNGCSGITPNSDETDGTNIYQTFGGYGGNGGSGATAVGGTTTEPVVNYNTYFSIQSGAMNPYSPSASSTMVAAGGTGGGGGGVTNNSGAGGGGAGGGGLIWIIYHSATWGTEQALGGSGGTAAGSNTNGEDGHSGTILKYQY